MAKNEKSIHFTVKKELFLRLQSCAEAHQLSMSQLLRHLVEKSLNLIDVKNTPRDPIHLPRVEVKESKDGKTIIFRDVEYTVGER